MLDSDEVEASGMSMKSNRIIAVIWGIFSVLMLVGAINSLFHSHYAWVPMLLILAGLGGYTAFARWKKSKSKASAVPSGGRSLLFHAIAVAVIYFVDALCFGAVGFSLLVMIIFILIGLGKTLVKAFRGQPILIAPLRNVAIYAICFVAVLSTIGIHNHFAKSRAEKVISAIKQYKAKYQRYPKSLQTMVPEFLPSVPLARDTFQSNDFKYWQHENLATLYYVALPPFGRWLFSFERDKWVYVD